MSDSWGLLFDLDGTLVDSLSDIARAMNQVLSEAGFPVHPPAAYRTMVGNGLARLVARAVPAHAGAPAVQACIARMEHVYHALAQEETQPYPDIPPLLEALARRGVPLAVLTNKPHAIAAELVSARFGSRFQAVFGGQPGVPLKPHPESARHALRTLGWGSAWLLGDSDVDMQTARAAGLQAVGCTWGFRTAAELRDSGADLLLDRPLDLLAHLD